MLEVRNVKRERECKVQTSQGKKVETVVGNWCLLEKSLLFQTMPRTDRGICIDQANVHVGVK